MKHALLVASVPMASSACAEPLIIDNGRLFIQARVNGVATEALLDSGAESSQFDPKLAAEAHFGTGEKVMMKGSGGEQAVEVVPNLRIEALGRTIPAAEVVVMDMTDLATRLIKRPTRAIVVREVGVGDATSSGAEFNIGTPILKHFVVTADFRGRSAWFAPVKGAGN